MEERDSVNEVNISLFVRVVRKVKDDLFCLLLHQLDSRQCHRLNCHCTIVIHLSYARGCKIFEGSVRFVFNLRF